MRLLSAAVVPLLVVPLMACAGSSQAERAAAPTQATGALADAPPSSGTDATSAARAVPRLKVTTLVSGLDKPWDVHELPGGRLLYTQRDRATLSVWREGRSTTLAFPSSSVWVSGETGLMGLEVDPDFATNRRVYTCQGATTTGGGHDVRVVAWTLSSDYTKATYARTLVKGFPTSTGRHGGCRLLIAKDGSMMVGTGDAAVGTNPRSLTSLGGKTLRLDRRTGVPWPTNRWIESASLNKRYLFSFGHRNVQGLAQRRDGTLWSIEQGTSRDDEVNRIGKGRDYGWNPVPGYDESRPMTDQGLPGTQENARWSSGDPTVATSGGDFVDGSRWGAYDGTLAVACLKAQRVLFLSFSSTGRLTGTRTPSELQQYGRIRTVHQRYNGDLLITTDNGGGKDVILSVSPA